MRLTELYNSLDVGKAINPQSCEGQMKGGLVQGFSWGLMEQMRYAEDGRNWNAGLLDYRVPTALDFPDIETVLVEEPTKNGPYGVKGIGEPPIAPGVAALVSAVADATGNLDQRGADDAGAGALRDQGGEGLIPSGMCPPPTLRATLRATPRGADTNGRLR